MKSSKSVYFDNQKGRTVKTLTAPVEVPAPDLKWRAPKSRRGSVHWQHPEIPTTITEGHVLVEVQKKAVENCANSPSAGECNACGGPESNSDRLTYNSDSPGISRHRSKSLPISSQQPFRLLRDRNWFRR